MYSSYSPLQQSQLAAQGYYDTQSTYLLVYAPGRNTALRATLTDRTALGLLDDVSRAEAEHAAALQPVIERRATLTDLTEVAQLNGELVTPAREKLERAIAIQSRVIETIAGAALPRG